MKIVTWNVNGIRACAKKGLVEFMEREDPEILCLQETKAHPEQLGEDLLSPLGRTSYWSSAVRKGYSGTVTYLKEGVEVTDVSHGIGIRKFDSEGRFVVTHHKDFDLYNVYFPNGSSRDERHEYKQEFLKKFLKHLQKEMKKGREIILVGDYNVAHLDIDVYDPIGLSQTSGFLPEERQWMDEFLDAGFVDVYRKFYPTEEQKYTWWSYRERARIANRGWRIDFICVTKGLEKRVTAGEILDDQQGSDHCPVVMELK